MDSDLSDAQNQKFKQHENQALATICPGITTNLQIYVCLSETAQGTWENLQKYFLLETILKEFFCSTKLYSAWMQKGQNMKEQINHIKTLSEHLEAIDHRIAEKDLVILLISSLPEEYN